MTHGCGIGIGIGSVVIGVRGQYSFGGSIGMVNIGRGSKRLHVSFTGTWGPSTGIRLKQHRV